MNIKALNSQDDGSVIASRRNGNYYAKECSVINLRRGGSQDITQILSAEGMATITQKNAQLFSLGAVGARILLRYCPKRYGNHLGDDCLVTYSRRY